MFWCKAADRLAIDEAELFLTEKQIKKKYFCG